MKYNILFKNEIEINENEPIFFSNLNLDQLVDSILRDKENYNLKKYFYNPLDLDNINYRLDVFREFDRRDFYVKFNSYIQRLKRLYDRYNENKNEVNVSYDGKKSLFKIINIYIEIIEEFKDLLDNDKNIKSEAILNLSKFINELYSSKEFKLLYDDTKRLGQIMEKIRYVLLFKGCDIYVSKYDDDKDFEPYVINALEGFEWESKKEFNYSVNDTAQSKLIDSSVLDALSKIYKDEFKLFNEYIKKYENFYNLDLYNIIGDARFYILYFNFMEKIKTKNLSFAYPSFIDDFSENIDDLYDLALANRLFNKKEEVVLNSFNLANDERIVVISGPNQGGKTTFARALGEIHYLASLGLPIPALNASLHLTHEIFTIFKTEEDMDSLNGKLQSELYGVKEIMDKLSDDSFIIFNEIFQSTTSLDGYELSLNIIKKIEEKKALAIFITFIDELSNASNKTIAYRSNVREDNPYIRTFKITKEKIDGRAYAKAISEKHHLSYEEIRERLK